MHHTLLTNSLARVEVVENEELFHVVSELLEEEEESALSKLFGLHYTLLTNSLDRRPVLLGHEVDPYDPQPGESWSDASETVALHSVN